MIKLYACSEPPETPANGVAIKIELINALSPKRHHPGLKVPPSKSEKRVNPSKARQSDVNPG
jgi:hypothetical protein